jgi:4-amino-4-deoxy-L-arabinose transferase-like glycosyltransferase
VTSDIKKVSPGYMAIILIVCVGLRMILFGIYQPWTPEIESQHVLQSDALGYHQLATTLLENQRFAYSSTGLPDDLRTPIYPLFIAVIYALFGHTPWIVLTAQIILDTISCFLLLASLSRLFNRRVAIIAATLYAFDPFLILYSSTTLLSDTLFVFFLILAFWFFSLSRHTEILKKTILYYGLSSLSLGLATLTRPISQFIILLFVGFLILQYWKLPKIAITTSIVSLLIFGLTLFPWLMRNYQTFGFFSLSTSDSYNLLVLDVVPMEMTSRQEDFSTVMTSLMAESEKMMEADGLHSKDLNEFQKGQYWRKLAIRYISADPAAFGKVYLLGIAHTLFNLDTTNYANIFKLPAVGFEIRAYPNLFDLVKAYLEIKGPREIIIGGTIALYLLFTYLCTVTGLFVSWRKNYDRPSLLLALLLAAYFIVITGPAGLARFKLPSIPFYFVFAGIGLSYLYEKIIQAKMGNLSNR